jgi:hypothetical protein
MRHAVAATTISLLCSIARATPALPVAPPEDDHGVPKEIADLIKQHVTDGNSDNTPEFDRAAHHKWAVERRNQLYASYRAIGAKFDEAWKDFSARKAVVDKAVADAEALVKDGKLDDARKLLETVITPAVRDAEGRLPRESKKRTFIEPRDAELPAALALFKVAKAQRDWNGAIAAKVDVITLHRIDQDETVERLLWIAWDRQDSLVGYNSSDTRVWANQQVKAAEAAVDGGHTIAATLDLGAAHAMISTEGKFKKGDYIVMPFISHAKITDKELSYGETLEWRVPVECHTTNRVSWIDDAGVFHYEDDCTYTYHSKKVTLTAALREPAPEWTAKSYGYTIIGKLVSAGPSWKLTDAVVLDLRYKD